MQIKYIKPKSVARVLGLLYAIIGFIFGLFVLLFSFLIPQENSGFAALVFGVGAPVFLTLLYGVMGYVTGFVTAWIYNFVAKKVGGIEIETE